MARGFALADGQHVARVRTRRQQHRLHLAVARALRGAVWHAAAQDGRRQEPGGWNRIVLHVDDLVTTMKALRAAGTRFRNEIEQGPRGKQILLEDPDGNPIEFHESPQ
jgi:catechol 2,3-dioxygenase-like lactoylglutathione lyase family enzyme